MGSSTGSDLCGKLNSTVTLDGTVYTKGGTSVLLVFAIKS